MICAPFFENSGYITAFYVPQVPNAGYEKKIQNSLFGALVHSRISSDFSMYTKLNIPDLPENRPREITIPKSHEVST